MPSPTTPRFADPARHSESQLELPRPMDDATTPTRASFGNATMTAQKPLPTSPFPQAVQMPDASDVQLPRRENSQHSRKSRDSEDMHMDDSDAETGGGDDVGSDDESVNADGSRSGKKKKSQRFYCTDYPPCNLSFTRSEHLARHIRRFSRLDNLRQHAQTVHVNEDIPIDSLAATGTRFQRQIRTDRVRPTGRARASTAGSIGAPVRGHSKSLSTSSIASIGSVGSNYSPRDDGRRRPAPLVMATDPRSRLSLDSYRSGADSQYSYRAVSPSDFSTPTSATFSTGPGSPRWASGMASPTSSHSRSQSMYTTGTRTPGRRLSVPSGVNPFQASPAGALGRPLFGPGPINSSNAGVFSSPNGSLLSSPTGSTFSRRESMSSAADEAWRRRTWHPESRDFNAPGSRLSNVITPSQFETSAAPLPIANPATQQTNLRLPGIETFLGAAAARRPASPPRRVPSPMMIDSDVPQYSSAPMPAPMDHSEDRRHTSQWETVHHGLNRLDIASNTTPPRDSAGAWASEANRAVQAQAEQARGQPTVRFEPQAQVVQIPATSGADMGPGLVRGHHHTLSAPVSMGSSTSRDSSKRHAWYHGPAVTVHEHQQQQGGDRVDRVDRMVHPNVSAFTGFPSSRVPQTVHEQQPLPTTAGPAGGPPAEQPDSMRRLEALVAVATSEGSTAKAY
ncbi:uncharacterized protein E0L32_000865 [Thyridium curvatum]|uniref:C2H2-type domain-containing protein n=1 Tax=Thyridium curvatum TaxID=1093900 RepID=A0A507B7F3_9PEZI|nr:uncharacterized protein E0L32_000865 [Thyridium curvatum]TPX12688.1 hypothetical protein E0L32_000865 [Thyridium curvatum]